MKSLGDTCRDYTSPKQLFFFPLDYKVIWFLVNLPSNEST